MYLLLYVHFVKYHHPRLVYQHIAIPVLLFTSKLCMQYFKFVCSAGACKISVKFTDEGRQIARDIHSGIGRLPEFRNEREQKPFHMKWHGSVEELIV